MSAFVHLRPQNSVVPGGDRHLVWMRGLGGPVAQIFFVDPNCTPQLTGSETAHALTTARKLSDRHAGLSLTEIAALHPPSRQADAV